MYFPVIKYILTIPTCEEWLLPKKKIFFSLDIDTWVSKNVNNIISLTDTLRKRYIQQKIQEECDG